jgi:8-oxo-dGTP pyrophosphatase MutT (NUDIX family)
VHREPLKALLRAYRAHHPDEGETVDRFEAFVLVHPDCFERSLTAGHVTGSAWVVDPSGADVLLTHHRKLDLWVQLGGHADGDPDIAAVARREAMEESGIEDLVLDDPAVFDLDVHLIPERRGEPAHFHYDVRFAFRAAHRTFRVSEESHELAWVPVRELSRVTTEPSMLRMARKWVAPRR